MLQRTLSILALTLPTLLLAQHWADIMDDKSMNFYEKQAAFEEYWDGKEYEKGKGYKQFKRWEWFWEPRVDAQGQFPDPQHTWKEWERFQKENKSRSIGKSNADWNPIGPSELSFVSSSPGIGRTSEVAEDPNNPNIIYVGTPAGGLWKTTDGGNSWMPMTDHLPSLGVSGIVVDPVDTDIVYIATGDGDANDTYSIGVLKSYDGGFTWEQTSLSWSVPSQRVSHKLIMDPSDNNVLLVATDEGIWKTINAGETWYQVQTGEIEDMEYHPTDPTIIYANGHTFYRSIDGGENFEASNEGLPSSSDVSRYSTAVSPDEPDWVYLLAGDADTQGFLGIYRSTDQGQTWTLRADSPNLMGWSGEGTDTGGQAWYDIAVEVDPDNADRVFVGGVNL
ncbi:MAG: glycosyl hydrolase, partial [Flavobacteriales bacterium]|nr:glycosyl hydrolase [Flavobacteriales bacterium]